MDEARLCRDCRIWSHHPSSSTGEDGGDEPAERARKDGAVKMGDEGDGKMARGRVDVRIMKLA